MILDTSTGFRLHESQSLAGLGKAVRQGSDLFLSPAMMTLVREAKTSEDLEKVLGSIPLVTLPEPLRVWEWK